MPTFDSTLDSSIICAFSLGVLLPGQRLEFPFIFKSPNAGIFTETWLFQTGPVLCRGRQVVFTLRGIAFQEDLNRHKREELEVTVCVCCISTSGAVSEIISFRLLPRLRLSLCLALVEGMFVPEALMIAPSFE